MIQGHQINEIEVLLESDSLLSLSAIKGDKRNHLEVGEILAECEQMLRNSPNISIQFIRRNANRVAYEMARIPCLANI